MKRTNAAIQGPVTATPMRDLARHVTRYLRRRRQYRDLADLPEHLLWDIGLTRDEVEIATKVNRLF